MTYRPSGWVKYHERFPSLSGNEYNPNSIQTPLTMEQAFEAGADAMLKALKTKTESLTPAVCSVLNGSWVFIPDEEEEYD